METQLNYNIEKIAKKHAIACHRMMNHKYDGDKDYEFHLSMAIKIGKFFEDNIPEKDRGIVFAAIWSHDTLEDCQLLCSFSDLTKLLGSQVSFIVKSVTTGTGTRKERFTDEYYKGIRETQYATFVKLCDRIANVQHSLNTKKPILDMYKKEHKHFKEMLYMKDEYRNMWNLLDYLIKQE